MDKPSNLQIQKKTSPYDADYYAKGPQNTEQTVQNKKPSGKKGAGIAGGLFTALKIAAAATSVVALGIAAKKGFGAIGKLFGKIPSKGKPKAPKSGSKNILGKITDGAKKGWGFVSGKACDFGKFVSGKFHDFVNFVKKKP